MTRVSACLFVLLLSFSAVPSAIAAPGAATLVAPSGDVSGSTITFSWQSEPTSTWYLFWLGKGSPTALVMEVWYTAAQAGCASGGTCSITLTPPLNAGGHTWLIQTWNSSGTGPWSTGKVFTVKDPTQNWSGRLPADRRFTLVFDGLAVLDNETGLTWQRTPGTTEYSWSNVLSACPATTTGERRGWRLPTVSELASLMFEGTGNVGGLPAGHPFALGVAPSSSAIFWTQTEGADTANAFFVFYSFSPGVSNGPKTWLYRAWCVRGPSGGGRQ